MIQSLVELEKTCFSLFVKTELLLPVPQFLMYQYSKQVKQAQCTGSNNTVLFLSKEENGYLIYNLQVHSAFKSRVEAVKQH